MADLTSFGVFFTLWVFQNGMMSYILRVEIDSSDYPGTSAPVRFVISSYINAIGQGNSPAYGFWTNLQT